MIIPDNSVFSSWRFVEVARYIPRLERVIRYRDKEKNPIMLEWGEEVDRYSSKYDNVGIYTSVFHFNSKDIDKSFRLSSLYFDLDSEDMQDSFREAKVLYSFFEEIVGQDNIRLYFTGSKGFHIEVEALALGVSPSNDLPVLFRFIAEKLREEFSLDTLDFAVYDSRRMWRLPYSVHQKTGLFKTELPKQALNAPLEKVKEYASERRYRVPPLPSLSTAGNAWYKELAAEMEEAERTRKREAAQRRIELFNKYGTSLLDGHSNSYIQKTWETALEQLRSTEANKNRNMTLSRQAYKVYLVHLESNKELESVTNTLYDVGIEIGLEPREISATLESARRAAEEKHETNPRTAYG